MPVTPGGGTANPPVSIMVGRFAPTIEIRDKCPLEFVEIEETGNHQSATMSLRILDKTLAYAAMRAEWRILFSQKNPVTGAWEILFRGFIRQPRPEIKAITGYVNVKADDVGTLLDRLIVKVQGVARNAASGGFQESTKARLQWLIGQPDGSGGATGLALGQPLIAEGLVDWSKVHTMKTDMPDQTFAANLTLRQCIERVLSVGSDLSPDYYLDPRPRLWTFTAETAAAVLDTSPYDLDVTASPGAGKIAPEDLVVEWDSSGIVTGYYARATTGGLSGFYVDSNPFSSSYDGAMASPYGIDLWGPRYAYIDAPDADTLQKVQIVVKSALRDTRNPIVRASWTVSGSHCYAASDGKRWQGGQLVNIKSAIHGVNGSALDEGPWAGSNGGDFNQLMPLRIKRVTTKYLNGLGDRQMTIEAGGRRTHLFAGAA